VTKFGSIYNYKIKFQLFWSFYNCDATIENLILSIRWLLVLFLSMNILICPISHKRHQITHILKVFYSDFGVYFYVCIKIPSMIYVIYHKYIFACVLIMCMYVYCSYNEFTN
jgi:hypothetical protein